jgi:ribonuclease J
MTEYKDLALDKKQLYFIPLGGSEEFGVNFNLYAHQGKWLIVDCGLGFADHRFPGVDILLPDASFVVERREHIAGLIITHAHEDHIGAVPHLWPRLRCPIYCSEFTAAVLRKKFMEAPACKDAKITIVNPGESTELGPFTAHFIHVAHSIPDTCSLVIEAGGTRVLHSGDWNLDPRPVLAAPTDEKAFRAFGAKGIDAYIGDSTNAEHPGRAGSESDVEEGLTRLFGECKGRIAITIFASNIGRLHSIVKAANANGRKVALVGRSLHTMTGAARDCGYLKDIPQFLDEDEISRMPNEKLVIILTGSQGEYRAALARISRGENRSIRLGRGDTVIFSSRAIPGNEVEINVVRNNLVAGGATVITPFDTPHKIHVSGHPYQGELADMYQWVKPKVVIPVHGERTQLEAQASFARQCQIENVIVPNNGSVIRLGPDKPGVIDHIPTAILAVEPKRILPSDHKAIAERRKLQFTGTVHATIVLNEKGDLEMDPKVATFGLIDVENEQEAQIEDELLDEIEDILSDMKRDHLRNDQIVAEELRIGIRRHILHVLGLKPLTTVHIVRI